MLAQTLTKIQMIRISPHHPMTITIHPGTTALNPMGMTLMLISPVRYLDLGLPRTVAPKREKYLIPMLHQVKPANPLFHPLPRPQNSQSTLSRFSHPCFRRLQVPQQKRCLLLFKLRRILRPMLQALSRPLACL